MPVSNIAAVLRPRTPSEAISFIVDAGDRARLLGGGTDLTIHCPPHVDRLIDLSRLDLGGIEVGTGGLTIGAMATLTEILEHPVVAACHDGVIPTMLRLVGSPLLRNVATIGGHLARGRLSDVVTVFLALDALVTFVDERGDERSSTLEDYYATATNRSLHLLTGVVLAQPEEGPSAEFVRFSRTAFDLAILNVCCKVAPDDGVLRRVRVVVGETPALARRVPQAESVLNGRELSPVSIAEAARTSRDYVETGDDSRASGAYRSHLVEVGVRRSLEALLTRMLA